MPGSPPESKGDRLTRLRASTTYAEKLKADYLVHFCLRVQKQQEYLKDSRRLREEVLPRIGDDSYEDDMRYNAALGTQDVRSQLGLAKDYRNVPVLVFIYDDHEKYSRYNHELLQCLRAEITTEMTPISTNSPRLSLDKGRA
jgi:hypothetical protein